MDEILSEIIMFISLLLISCTGGTGPSLGVQQKATPITTGFETQKSLWELVKEMDGQS